MAKAKPAGLGKTKAAIKQRTIADMKALGVHQPQYNRLVEIYAELVEQYNTLTQQFKDSEYAVEVATLEGGLKKAPIVATLESLRKDILAYSDRLCLNPQAIRARKPDGRRASRLGQVLSELQ